MTESRKILASNSRLLYKISHKVGLDWRKVLLQLDDYLDKSPLQKANPFICLYYFLPSANPDFFSKKSWVCREIIGLPRLNNDSEFHLYDLAKSMVWSTPWQGALEELIFERLWKWEDETRRTLPPPLVDTWCLKIAVEEEAFLSMELHHFPR